MKLKNKFNDTSFTKEGWSMEQKKTFRQMVEVNKITFDNIYNASVLVQNQFERIANAALEQVPGVSEEGHKAIEHWAELFKSGRNSFKLQMDKNFEQAEKLFISS